MAQVTGGSDYDIVWDEKVVAAVALLREVSDAAALGRPIEVSEDFVISALLKTLAFSTMPRIRKLKDWEGITKSIAEELKQLKQLRMNALPEDCQSMERELRVILSQATASWEDGDPENPQTETVLNTMVAALFKRKFVHNPPRPNYD